MVYCCFQLADIVALVEEYLLPPPEMASEVEMGGVGAGYMRQPQVGGATVPRTKTGDAGREGVGT